MVVTINSSIRNCWCISICGRQRYVSTLWYCLQFQSKWSSRYLIPSPGGGVGQSPQIISEVWTDHVNGMSSSRAVWWPRLLPATRFEELWSSQRGSYTCFVRMCEYIYVLVIAQSKGRNGRFCSGFSQLFCTFLGT